MLRPRPHTYCRNWHRYTVMDKAQDKSTHAVYKCTSNRVVPNKLQVQKPVTVVLLGSCPSSTGCMLHKQSLAPQDCTLLCAHLHLQVCMVISTNTGRVYRPRDCERLIIFLKDINLPKPDKWGTSQLIAFLQQVGCFLWIHSYMFSIFVHIHISKQGG